MKMATIKKLLEVDSSGGELPDDGRFIAIQPKTAVAIWKHVADSHTMLVGVEECKLTAREIRQLLIRLYPESKNIMRSSASMVRVMSTVAEHLFIAGSGDPSDIAKFRYILKTLLETGNVPHQKLKNQRKA